MSDIATMLFARDDDQKGSPLMSHKSSNDTVFQLVLSIALGVSCFLAFCVSSSNVIWYTTVFTLLGPPSKMVQPLRCAKKKETRGQRTSRSSEHTLWLDASTMAGHRSTDTGGCWTGCLCFPQVLPNGCDLSRRNTVLCTCRYKAGT